MSEQRMVKVLLQDDVDVETLWAEEVAPGRFKLLNIPFFAYGVSEGDIVSGEPEAENFYRFTGMLEKLGNRTVRLASEDRNFDNPAFIPLLEALKRVGCSYEGMNKKLLCLTVPPATELAQVVEILNGSGILWEHADPTYNEIHGESDSA